MGNTQLPPGVDPINDVKKIYWDQEGNLRYGNSDRNRDEEIINILQSDSNDDSDLEKIWMIIPSRWVKQWLLFSYHKVCDPPGKIDMFLLLTSDNSVESGWRPKRNLKPPISAPSDPRIEDHPGHYRRVSYEVWTKLIDLYGLEGFAIAVRGAPVDDISRWRVVKTRFVDPDLLPAPILPEDYISYAHKDGTFQRQDSPTKGTKSMKKPNNNKNAAGKKKGGFFSYFIGGGGSTTTKKK